MDFSGFAFFVILLVISIAPIILVYRVYQQYGNRFYLFFILYDSLLKVFLMFNLFSRDVVNKILIENSVSVHLRIVVGMTLNFISYPFLMMAIYMFMVFMVSFASKKLPRQLKWIYITVQILIIIFFILFTIRTIDQKIGSWDVIINNPGIIIGNLIIMLFYYAGIYLFFHYSRQDVDKKKTSHPQLSGIILPDFLYHDYLLYFKRAKFILNQ